MTIELENIVATACHYDENDDAEVIAAVVEATTQVIKYQVGDTLKAIYHRGPLSDGDVPSKSDRDVLLNLGVIVKCVVKGEDGYQACNYLGGDVVRVLNLQG